VKPRQRVQELLAGKANFLSLAGFHSSFDELRGSEQFRMWRQNERGDPVTFVKESEFFFPWWRIGEHAIEIGSFKSQPSFR